MFWKISEIFRGILSWVMIVTLLLSHIDFSAFAEGMDLFSENLETESPMEIETPSSFVQSDKFMQIVINTRDELPSAITGGDLIDSEIAVFCPDEGTIIDKSAQIEICKEFLAEEEKNSYNITFSAERRIGKIGESKTWTAFSSRFDNTLVRNYIAMNLASDLGLEYAPGCDFAELWLNGSFLGCYLIAENYLESLVKEIDPEENEFLIEASLQEEEETNYYTTQDGLRFCVTEPASPTEEQKLWIANSVDTASAAIESGSFLEVEKYIDVDSFARAYLINEFLSPEGFNKTATYFYYKDDRLHAGLVWNYDISSGNYGADAEFRGTGEEETCANGWYSGLLKYPVFVNLAENIYIENRGLFENCSAVDGFVDSTAAKYSELFQKNFASKEDGGAGWKAADKHVTAEHALSMAKQMDSDVIVVDASGNGDYESFTQAIYDNYSNSRNVVVREGVYDIRREYEELFGQSLVDNLADSTELGYCFQFGVRISNRMVIFEEGSQLVCDWTGHVVDGVHRFSPIAIGSNVVIDGMNLDSTNTFYCIHDDYGFYGTFYNVLYRNCNITGHNIAWGNCIGGGCKAKSLHIVENCTFDNGGTETSVTVRYHNTFEANAEPLLYFSDSTFNGVLSFNWYGSQTTRMKAFVTNCEAGSIEKRAEIPGETNDNIELEIRNVGVDEIYDENLSMLKYWMENRLKWMGTFLGISSVRTDVTEYCGVLSRACALEPENYLNYAVLRTALEENQLRGTESQNEIDAAALEIENAINKLQLDEGRQPSEDLNVLQQPCDQSGQFGETVEFIYKVEGNGLSYQWYEKTEGDEQWTRSDENGNQCGTLKVGITLQNDGKEYRCVARDENGKHAISVGAFLTKEAVSCSVTWKGGDGEVLAVDSVELGTHPEYGGSVPQKSATPEFSYSFAGWSPEITSDTVVKGDIEYTAQFDSVKRKYDIVWMNENGAVIDTTKEEYGATPTHAEPENQNGDIFAGWEPAITIVTESTVYRAVFRAHPDGINEENGVLKYYLNNKFQSQVNSFVDINGTIYRIRDGIVVQNAYGLIKDPSSEDRYYCRGGIVQTGYSGLHRFSGIWYYFQKGKVDTETKGFISSGGSRFYISGGQVKTDANGLVRDPDTSEWYYCAAGVVQAQYTGLCQFDGAWFYVQKGKLSTEESGFVDYNGSMFYVGAGQLMTNVNGLAQDPMTGAWYYCAGGCAQTQYTGLCQYNGAWFYISKGIMDTSVVGFVEYDGGRFYVGAGQLMTNVSGLAQDPSTGEWYFLSNGQIQDQYTGLCQYNGSWFYVKAGRFSTDFSGEIEYNGSWFNVVNGEVK